MCEYERGAIWKVPFMEEGKKDAKAQPEAKAQAQPKAKAKAKAKASKGKKLTDAFSVRLLVEVVQMLSLVTQCILDKCYVHMQDLINFQNCLTFVAEPQEKMPRTTAQAWDPCSCMVECSFFS